MHIEIDLEAPWYHGSDKLFNVLYTSSTITQWQALAEAFSHQPSQLSYDDTGEISHNGTAEGYLYVIDEPIEVGTDAFSHPNTSMDKNAEFITKRPLKVKLIKKL